MLKIDARLKFITLFSALFLPALTFAAFDDVTLTTDTVISVGGYTINVSGSSAVIESIVVDSSSFDVAMQSGSSITINAPDRNLLSATSDSDVTATNTCNSSASTLALSATGEATITITPLATLCTTSSSGGGSGGRSVSLSDNEDTATSTNATLTELQQKVKELQAELARLLVLRGGTTVLSSDYTFLVNLQLNDTGIDVQKLQQYLNANGFVLATNGAGSPGNETMYFGSLTYNALIQFQNAHASEILTPVGLTAGSGYFGPSTRAYVNNH